MVMAMGVALSTAAQTGANLLKGVKVPDAKLNDGIFASAPPLQSHSEQVYSVFGWTPIYLDIDLGKVQPIAAIRLHSDRPDYACEGLLVLGSRDGEKWFKITDLATPEHKSVQDNGRLVYSDNNIRTSAKLLKFVLMRRNLPTTFFFDELEVLAAQSEWKPEQYVETPIADVKVAVEDALTVIGARNRLRKDADALRGVLKDSPTKLAALEQLAKEFSKVEVPAAVIFSSRFPQNKAHAELFRLYAAHLSAKGTPPLSVWSPYRYVFPNTFMEPANNFNGLEFNMLQDMTRSALVQMLNSTDGPMIVNCSFDGPQEVLDALELSWLPWTDTAEGIPVSTILLPMPQKGKVELLPGLMVRLWLNVDSSKLKEGTYNIIWNIGDKKHPVRINVAKRPPVKQRPPTEPCLLVGSWDYTDTMPKFGLTDDNLASAVALMDKMHINVPWNSNSIDIPKPEDFDEKGNFIGKIDSGLFETWLKNRPDKPMYCCFINAEADVRVNIGGRKLGSDMFMACATSWIRAWDKRMQKLGMTPGSVQWLLVDEVTTDRKAEIQVAWSRAFKAANPKVLRNWNDPLIDVKQEKYKEMLDLVDSLCVPHGIEFSADDWKVYQEYQKSGKKLWSYLCNGPSRLFDPFSYYKMHGVSAWMHGIVGIGFWSFGDSGSAKPFNEYTLHWAIFTPACLDKNKVYSTLALEALREGIEDNEILRTLEERLPLYPEEDSAKGHALLEDFKKYIRANTDIHIKWYDAAKKLDREKADSFIDEAIKMLNQK